MASALKSGGLLAVVAALIAPPLQCDTAYFQRTFFDNSITSDSYFHSTAKNSEPSRLESVGGKLPVETQRSFTPPNSLRLRWTSRTGGGWEAEIQLYEWRNRPIEFPGDTLQFWMYAPESIGAAELPRIVLRDKDKNFTQPFDLARAVRSVPFGKWIQVSIPLQQFTTASIRGFDGHRVTSIFFVQGNADGKEHTLFLDEFRIDQKAALNSKTPTAPPQQIKAKAYERHVDVSWLASEGAERYIIYRSLGDASFKPVGIQVPDVNRYEDFLGKPGLQATYKIKASGRNYVESNFSEPVSAATHSMSDDDLLTMVQEASFRYYWEGAHPVSGMTRENLPGDDRIVATGATGFGVMALVVGVDRGFITRDQGLARLLRMTKFLERADRFHGAWPHFMDGATGRRMPVFDMFDNGADLVETSFLMEGLLTARQYFRGPSGPERELYDRITSLWNGVEWDWFRRTPNGGTLLWHWSPEYTWYINHPLYGWNEVMVTYLLAIASPTHGVPAGLYYSGWAGDPKEFVNGHKYFGIELDLGMGTGGPLFFTHYSYMGFDPHGIRDKFANYFENNRNMARINHAYCVKNPEHYKTYSDESWGITAVDGPNGYVPYEPTPDHEDGTIAPTGAVASFPYTPEDSMAALKYFYRELGSRLWDVYGFRDAFNLQQNWFARINMGLNQAPMAVMIENYRTGLVWKNFMANPEIRPMLERTGLIANKQ